MTAAPAERADIITAIERVAAGVSAAAIRRTVDGAPSRPSEGAAAGNADATGPERAGRVRYDIAVKIAPPMTTTAAAIVSTVSWLACPRSAMPRRRRAVRSGSGSKGADQ